MYCGIWITKGRTNRNFCTGICARRYVTFCYSFSDPPSFRRNSLIHLLLLNVKSSCCCVWIFPKNLLCFIRIISIGMYLLERNSTTIVVRHSSEKRFCQQNFCYISSSSVASLRIFSCVDEVNLEVQRILLSYNIPFKKSWMNCCSSAKQFRFVR